MTRLRLVETPRDLHSVRVPASALTADHIADLHLIAANVLAPTQVACRELERAIKTSDRDLLITSMRRLVAVSGLARIQANTLEGDPLWKTPS